YQANIGQKIHSLRDSTGKGGVVDRTSKMVKNLDKEIEKPGETDDKTAANQPGANSPSIQQQSPVPVEVRQAASTPLQLIYGVAAALLQPLTTAGIVIVFVIFFLLQREDLRDRFIRLAGAGDLRRTTVALDDAAKRLSRYLLTQTAVNASFGCWWAADCGLSASRTQDSGASSGCYCALFPTSVRSSRRRYQ